MGITIQETIIRTLENGGWLTFFVIFWSGALLSLSSCTIVRIPVVIGYVGGVATSKKRAVLLTFSFVSALVLSYTCLGVLFGLVSSLMIDMIKWSRYLYYLIGTLALVIGLRMAGLVNFGLLPAGEHKMPKFRGPRTVLGAFLFGITFAIFEAPTCPCCGPVLFMMASLTFAKGKIFYAVLVFLAYALGQSFPILMIGSFTSIMKYISPKVERIEGALRIIGGNILIVLAIYFFLVG